MGTYFSRRNTKKGSFSLRTLGTLTNMNEREAKLFADCAKFNIITPYNECFLINSDEALVPDEDNGISGLLLCQDLVQVKMRVSSS